MTICASCKKDVVIDKFFSRSSVCPHCGEDLRSCINCRNYSEKLNKKCLEDRAEKQRTTHKSNFCDFFKYNDSTASSKQNAVAENAKKSFEDLFKK